MNSIQTPRDYWNRIVIPDYVAFQKRPGDLRLAFHIANSLFHMSDWIYQGNVAADGDIFAFTTADGSSKCVNSEKEMADALSEMNPKFELLRSVSNAGKHLRLRPRSQKSPGAADNAADVQIQSTTWLNASWSWDDEKARRSWDQMDQVVLEGTNEELSGISTSVYDTWIALSDENQWNLSSVPETC